jgi:hypothetical protein
MTLSEDVLGYIKDNWPGAEFPVNLTRVNRNDSTVLSGNTRELTEMLKQSNYVGVRDADEGQTPIGTRFAYISEPVVNVRVVGMDSTENFGHISDHNEFKALVQNIKEAIRAEQTYPAVTRPGEYHTILEQNFSDQSANYGDYYIATWDLQFRGYDGC